VTPLLVTLGAMIVVTHTIRHLSGWLGERWGGLLIGLPISTALTLLHCLWECGPRYAATAVEATDAHRPKSPAREGPTRRGEFACNPFLLRSSRPTHAGRVRQRAQDRHADAVSSGISAWEFVGVFPATRKNGSSLDEVGSF